MARIEPVSEAQLLQQAPLDEATAVASLQTLVENGQIIRLDQQLLTRPFWQRTVDKALTIIESYQQQNRLKLGISREELRSRLKLKTAVFNAMLQELSRKEKVVEANALVHLPDHTIRFTLQQKQALQALDKRFAQGRRQFAQRQRLQGGFGRRPLFCPN